MQGFEESYVLESTDGLGYTQIKPLPPPTNESDDDRLARLRRSQLDTQHNLSLASLRQQLAEQQQRKDEQWKEMHNPFKPPRGLDGEEVSWLEDEEERRRERERRRKEEEEEERMAFELAVAKRKEEEAQRQSESAGKQQSAVLVAGRGAVLPSIFSFAAESEDGMSTTSTTSGVSTGGSVGVLSGLGVIRVKRKDESAVRQTASTTEKVKKVKLTDDQSDAAHNSRVVTSASSPTTSSRPTVMSTTVASSTSANGTSDGAALSALLSYSDDDDD